jgi:hypothetical protein
MRWIWIRCDVCGQDMKLKNVLFNWLETRSPRDRLALGTSLAITSSQVDIRRHHGRSRHSSQVISLKGPQSHRHALLQQDKTPRAPRCRQGKRMRGDDTKELVFNRMIGQFDSIPTSRKLFLFLAWMSPSKGQMMWHQGWKERTTLTFIDGCKCSEFSGFVGLVGTDTPSYGIR